MAFFWNYHKMYSYLCVFVSFGNAMQFFLLSNILPLLMCFLSSVLINFNVLMRTLFCLLWKGQHIYDIYLTFFEVCSFILYSFENAIRFFY